MDINNNGTIISGMWSISGDQGQYWKEGWLDLSPWAGQTNLRVRFRAVTGSGPLSDIAIDDVRVANVVPVFGCDEPTAANYNGSVNINNGSCDYSCAPGQKRVRIDLVADNYPDEISWSLKNGSTGVNIVTGTSAGTTVCVPENTCLVFRINDSYGDGICCGYGNGQYAVYLDGALVVQGGNYGAFQETTFNCPPGFSCRSAIPIAVPALTGQFPQVLATITTTDIEQWYDFTPPQTGAYTITTCGTNTCDTRLWLYDMNCGQVVLSDGIEGATFGDDNDGGCGAQAVVNANMPGGVVHHLRVGDNAGDRSGQVTFSIVYNGPVLMPAPPADYHVAIRHRNHLGCMTTQPVSTSNVPLTVDLRAPGTATWGTEARKEIGNTTALWMGNAQRDNKLLYTGGDNDRDPILQVVGGVVPTGSSTGYYLEDTNMSGVVKYTGANNDRDPILANIGGVVPTASRMEQLP